MMVFLTVYNLTGLVIGVATFLIIGLFHPFVIKGEYYFGVRCWWFFLLMGVAAIAALPFWDSLTTSLSIVGMWMLSRKYLEQWFVWFVVNLVTVGLYFYKEIPLTALLYTIYLTMSLAGYFRWRRMMRRQMRG